MVWVDTSTLATSGAAAAMSGEKHRSAAASAAALANIAIIERDGAIINDAGLDIEAVHQHRVENGGVKGFPGSEHVEDGHSILEKECDILLPAALESQITLENADRIQTKIINFICNRLNSGEVWVILGKLFE